MTPERILAERIRKAEEKLEELKSKYIVKYGYNNLTIDSGGNVSGSGDMEVL